MAGYRMVLNLSSTSSNETCDFEDNVETEAILVSPWVMVALMYCRPQGEKRASDAMVLLFRA